MLQLYFKFTVALKNVVHVVAILYFKQRARVPSRVRGLGVYGPCTGHAILLGLEKGIRLYYRGPVVLIHLGVLTSYNKAGKQDYALP